MTGRPGTRAFAPDQYDALSFDCYGTLIDWEAGIAAVLRPWARSHGLTLDDEALLAVYARHESRVEAEQPGELYPAVLARTFRAVGEEVGVPVSLAEAAALGASVPDWPAFPDSGAALRSLATRFSLVILSNVDRASFAASEARLGVTFDHVITAQDVGSYKPDPRNFDVLLARTREWGIGEGRLLHVAQSLFHDHVPARAAGLRSVWINRRAGRAGWGATPEPVGDAAPDWEFGSMAAFAEACETGGTGG